MKRHLQIGILTALMWILLPMALHATPVGKVTAIEGKVDLTASGREAIPVTPGDAVNVGDIIRTKSKSKCEVTFIDGNILRLAESTRVQISEYMIENDKRQETIGLLRGKIRSIVQKGIHAFGTERGGHYEVRTPTAVLGVRGSDVINFHLNSISGGVLVTGSGYGYPIANPRLMQNYGQGQGLTIIDPNLAPILRSVNLQQLNQHIYDTNLGSGSGPTTISGTSTATTVSPGGTPNTGGLLPAGNILTLSARERITSIAPMTTVLRTTTVMTTTVTTTTVRPTTTTVPSTTTTTTSVPQTTTTTTTTSVPPTTTTTTTSVPPTTTTTTTSVPPTTTSVATTSTTTTRPTTTTTSTSSYSTSTPTTCIPGYPGCPDIPEQCNRDDSRKNSRTEQIGGTAGYARGLFTSSDGRKQGTYTSQLDGTHRSAGFFGEAGNGNLFHTLTLYPGGASPPSSPAGFPGEGRIGALPVAGAWMNINEAMTGISGGQLSYQNSPTGWRAVAAGSWIETNRFINMLSSAPGVLDLLNIPRNAMGFVPLSGGDSGTNVSMTAYFYGYSFGPPRIWVASPVTGSTSLANPVTGTPVRLGGPGFANNINFTFTNWNAQNWAATVNSTSPGQIGGYPTQIRGYSAGAIGATSGNPPLTTFSGTAAGVVVP